MQCVLVLQPELFIMPYRGKCWRGENVLWRWTKFWRVMTKRHRCRVTRWDMKGVPNCWLSVAGGVDHPLPAPHPLRHLDAARPGGDKVHIQYRCSSSPSSGRSSSGGRQGTYLGVNRPLPAPHPLRHLDAARLGDTGYILYNVYSCSSSLSSGCSSSKICCCIQSARYR